MGDSGPQPGGDMGPAPACGAAASPQPPPPAARPSSAPGQDADGRASRLRRSISAASTAAGALAQLCSCADSASRPPSQLAARASPSLPGGARGQRALGAADGRAVALRCRRLR